MAPARNAASFQSCTFASNNAHLTQRYCQHYCELLQPDGFLLYPLTGINGRLNVSVGRGYTYIQSASV